MQKCIEQVIRDDVHRTRLLSDLIINVDDKSSDENDDYVKSYFLKFYIYLY